MSTIEYHRTDLGTITTGVIPLPLGDPFATGDTVLFDQRYRLPLAVEVRLAAVPGFEEITVDVDVYDHDAYFVDGRTTLTGGIVATLTAALTAVSAARAVYGA